ncbi:MAG: hypothetical protein JSU04_09195 [Bdellovibrionales bacterium]|nr:hypothetical protein [Bdellovibrionales bacterium]
MSEHRLKLRSSIVLRTQTGSTLLTALGMSVFVCLMIMMSAIWIQSRVNQVMSSSDKMDHRIVLDGLFAYTVNGIKQSWCFSDTWVQDNACNLFHARNTVRLLLSDETLNYLGSSKTPHPDPVINTRLMVMTQTVPLAAITPSHPLFSITQPLNGNYENVTFNIKRESSAISTTKGNEIPLRISIKLVAKASSSFKDLELQSKVIVYPRELSYFGLIVPKALYLGMPAPTAGDVSFASASSSVIQGLRFESPVFVNGDLHLPPKTANADAAMDNVTFLDKIVIGGGLIYQGAGQTLFNPGDAGGEKNMYNHELTSFTGLLAGYELDPEKDKGLEYLFNVNSNITLTDFDLCRKRIMASFDLSTTKDTQLFSRFNGSPAANSFDLSLNIGIIDNLIEQFQDTGGTAFEIATNVPNVTTAGKIVSWQGGAVFKAKLIYEGLNVPSAGTRDVYFNTFYLPRNGEVALYPLGAGGPEVHVRTSPHMVSGKKQYNQVDMNVTFTDAGNLDIGAYTSGNVLTQGSVKLVLEGMDYAYNYATNLRDNSSSHPVMGVYKSNGFTFYKSSAASFDVYRQTAGGWYTNPMLQVDTVNYPVYDASQAPNGETDFSAFDAQCMAVPGNTDAYYTSFPSADWSISFASQARHAWSFTADFPDGYLAGILHIDAGTAAYNPGAGQYPTFKIQSLVQECMIEADANFVTGFYTCEKLTIKPRSTPLRIIGTIIAGNIDIHPSAYQAGIRWSTIYHPQAVYELRQARVLGRDKKGAVLDCASPSLPPLWMPNIGAISVMTHYACNPVSLRQADPFKWTGVDPDCGLETPQSTKVTCKKQTTRFLLKEVSRTKGL